MLAEIGAVLTSGGFGAITGLIGGLGQKWLSLKHQRQEQNFKFQMAKASNEEAKSERDHSIAMADKHLEVVQSEGEIASEIADVHALEASIRVAGKDSGVHWVEAVKHLMRPIITLFLLVQVEWLLYVLWGKVGGLEAMTQLQAYEIFMHIVKQVVFLAVTAVSWWFASRPSRNK
jgi:hypothetical protein